MIQPECFADDGKDKLPVGQMREGPCTQIAALELLRRIEPPQTLVEVPDSRAQSRCSAGGAGNLPLGGLQPQPVQDAYGRRRPAGKGSGLPADAVLVQMRRQTAYLLFKHGRPNEGDSYEQDRKNRQYRKRKGLLPPAVQVRQRADHPETEGKTDKKKLVSGCGNPVQTVECAEKMGKMGN